MIYKTTKLLLIQKRQLDELAESDLVTHTLSDSAELQKHNPKMLNSAGADMPTLWKLIQDCRIDARICDALKDMEQIPNYFPTRDYQAMGDLLKNAVAKETDPAKREKLEQAQEKLAIAANKGETPTPPSTGASSSPN